MDTFNNVFDLVIIIGGSMILYYAVQMKANEVIKVGVLISPKVNIHTMKDKKGFINYSFPRHAIQGCALALLGMAGILTDLINRPDLHVIIYAVALAVLVVGNIVIEKGKKKFY